MTRGRKPQLSITHCAERKKPWLINIPASLSENGKRQREYHDSKRQAEARIRELTRIAGRESSRTDLAAVLQPYGASLWDAVNAFVEMQERFRPQLVKVGGSVEEAIQFYLDHAKQRAASIEFGKAVTEFKEAKADRRARTKDDYTHVFGRLTLHFKGKLVSEITSRDLEAVISKECPGTYGRRKFMAVSKTFFNWSIRRDYAAENPVLKLDPVRLRSTEKAILTNQQVRDLLRACTDEMLPYYLFGIFCGIRPKELQRLEWKHVDIAEGHVHVPGSLSKTWDARYVDLPENLREWLATYGRDRCGRICPGDFGQKHRDNYRGAGFKEWKQDVMRHTFASNHLAHFGNLDQLLQAMGHRSSPQTLWRHYHKARTKKEAAEFWAIEPTCRQTDGSLAIVS